MEIEKKEKVFIIISSSDNDHCKYLPFLLQNLLSKKEKVELLISGSILKYKDLMKYKNFFVFHETEQQPIPKFDNLNILSSETTNKIANDNSIVVEIDRLFFPYKVCIPGDSQQHIEKKLITIIKQRNCNEKKFFILVASHHSSITDNTNSEEWLKLIDPKIIIVSSGMNKKYKVPKKEYYLRVNSVCKSLLKTNKNPFSYFEDEEKIIEHDLSLFNTFNLGDIDILYYKNPIIKIDFVYSQENNKIMIHFKIIYGKVNNMKGSSILFE